MSDQQKKPDLGLLEEDDEFEEFPAEGNDHKYCSVTEHVNLSCRRKRCYYFLV